MKRLSLIIVLIFTLLPSIVFGETATLTWEAPTTNTDGSTITDLAGYYVYKGLTSGTYEMSWDVGNVTTYMTPDLPDGTHYFVVTAYDTSANESAYSNEVDKEIKTIPNAPVLISVIITVKNGSIVNVYVNNETQ